MKIKQLNDEVIKVAKECDFDVIGIKHFENDTIYYLKEINPELTKNE